MLSEVQKSFIHQRSVQLETGNRPSGRKLEAACYKLIACNEPLPGMFTPVRTNGVLVALVDRSLEYDDFLQKVVGVRSEAFKEVKKVAHDLDGLGIPGISRFGELDLPVVILNADTADAMKSIGFISDADYSAALDETPYWKASEHMLFLSSADGQHDFKRYAIKSAEETGLQLPEFLHRQQVHEGLHPIIDHLTDLRFHDNATWLNEGFCELYAGFEPRAQHVLNRRKDLQPLTAANIMASADSCILYGGGYYLLKSIGLSVNPHNVRRGVGLFIKTMFDRNTVGESLNESAQRTIGVMGMGPKVEENLQSQIQGSGVVASQVT